MPVKYETMVELIPFTVEKEKLSEIMCISPQANSLKEMDMGYDKEKDFITSEKYLMEPGTLITIETLENEYNNSTFLSDTKIIENYKYKITDVQKKYNVFGDCINSDELAPNMITEEELKLIKTRK